jgi:hypothetical protein
MPAGPRRAVRPAEAERLPVLPTLPWHPHPAQVERPARGGNEVWPRRGRAPGSTPPGALGNRGCAALSGRHPALMSSVWSRNEGGRDVQPGAARDDGAEQSPARAHQPCRPGVLPSSPRAGLFATSAVRGPDARDFPRVVRACPFGPAGYSGTDQSVRPPCWRPSRARRGRPGSADGPRRYPPGACASGSLARASSSRQVSATCCSTGDSPLSSSIHRPWRAKPAQDQAPGWWARGLAGEGR